MDGFYSPYSLKEQSVHR